MMQLVKGAFLKTTDLSIVAANTSITLSVCEMKQVSCNEGRDRLSVLLIDDEPIIRDA